MACQAATVTVMWDHNDPLPDGYRVYARQADAAYDHSSPVWDGQENTATLTIDDGTIWYFVVTAYCVDCGSDGQGLESADSEEVSYDATVIVPPVDPENATPPTGFAVTWEKQFCSIFYNTTGVFDNAAGEFNTGD